MSAALELEAPSSTSLAVIPASAVSTIIAADVDGILGAYAAKVRAFRPDISTKAGRDEMKSLAAEGRTVKASLLRLAAGLKESAIKTQRAINAEERVLEEKMNALIADIRAPLTAFENAEKQRVADHEAALARLQENPAFYAAPNEAADYQARLDWLHGQPQRDWQEFAQRAADVLADEIAKTTNAIAVARKREAEAAELARLRAEAEERARQDAARQQAEREARLVAEAADKARRDAEAKAERERQETLRAAAEERARVEREAAAEQRRIEAERQAAHDRAEAAERRRIADAAAARDREEAAARKAEADRVAAEQKAKRDQEAAVAAERKRHADEQAERDREAAAAQAAADERAANRAHQAAINNAAVEALLALTHIDEQTARQVIVVVARNEIPAMRIEY